MVKKSLKRFHIDYYLVIKFLINTGLKRGFKYIYKRLLFSYKVSYKHMPHGKKEP